MCDALFDYRSFRNLTVVDRHSREGLAAVVSASVNAFQGIETQDCLACERRKPRTIRCDCPPSAIARHCEGFATGGILAHRSP
jgi:hypothetical protein